MREELSELVRFESSDPRLAGVDVTEVIVAQDLRKADVLVSLPDEAEARAEALLGLESARFFLRRRLMERMELHRMPELRFRPAAELAGGAALAKLLRRTRRGRPKPEVE
jgi:ribosome-binding factor A